MQPFPFGNHVSLVLLEIVALLVLVILGFAADAYFCRRKLVPAHATEPAALPARATLAAWHRAAWRRANREAACTHWHREVDLQAKPKSAVGHGPALTATTQGSKSSALEFKPGVGTNLRSWQS